VYVAPLEALVAEKFAEWSEKLGKGLGVKVARLTGAAD
jgi:replicative superfamily II helicase